MKKLEEFYETFVNEAARRQSTTKQLTAADVEEIAKNAVPLKDVKPKDLKPRTKKDEKVPTGKTGNDGCYCLEPVTNANWEAELAEWTMEDIEDNINAIELSERFDDKKDFLVLGEAGWAKTALITSMAHKFGYNVMTVYLDKAMATDLGGIPVPMEDEEGFIYQHYGMPGWALYMAKHKNEKFLLFFDEMNQAQPDVMNALMPIVLKHVVCGVEFDNFIVGAAGNLMSENEMGVNELSKPLRDRFKPIIEWEVHTEEAWNAAFKWLHSKFDEEVGVDFMNMMEQNYKYWSSPRDVELVILNFVRNNVNGAHPSRKYTNPRIVKNHLDAIIWDGVDRHNRTFEKDMNAIADAIIEYISTGKPTEKKSRGGKLAKVDPDVLTMVKRSLLSGIYNNAKTEATPDGDNKNYVCTVENCVGMGEHDLFSAEETHITAEVFNKLLRDIAADGKQPKYQTIADAKKDPVLKRKGVIFLWSKGPLFGTNIVKPDDYDDDDNVQTPHTND